VLLWKLFAVGSVLFYLAWWHAVLTGRTKFETYDYLGVPIDIIAYTGLISLAFSLSTLPKSFWVFFHPVFAAWSAYEIIEAGYSSDADIGALLGVFLVVLMAAFIWLALYQLAGSPWEPILGF
jgi:hypothetical protein